MIGFQWFKEGVWYKEHLVYNATASYFWARAGGPRRYCGRRPTRGWGESSHGEVPLTRLEDLSPNVRQESSIYSPALDRSRHCIYDRYEGVQAVTMT